MNAWTLALAGSLKSILIPCSLQKLKSFSPTTQKKWDFSLIHSLDNLRIEIQNERLHQIESLQPHSLTILLLGLPEGLGKASQGTQSLVIPG